MFNFFVTSALGAWEATEYEYSRSRFLEYTSKEIASKFRELESPQLDILKSLPCLFAYEGKTDTLHIGKLTNIKFTQGKRNIIIQYEIDNNINPIPFQQIAGVVA